MPLEAGQRLGPYEIVSPLGAGGMGEVYEAKDTRLGRTVAIKVLPEGLAENPERRARFEREARTVSQLSHPHVCTLYDVGEEEGVHFLVMEHLEGETLAERLERGALPLEETLRHGAQIAEALDAAHRRGVVHRDLKPANVMLTSSGVKLLDFGLARVAAGGGEDVADLPTMTMRDEGALTDEGTVLGTYPYMSPEQVEGAEADARSDIFALGAVLYEMATGKRAFEGKSAASVMAAVLREEPEPITKVEPVCPPALDHVISRCLAKDPERRWQTARDVAEELRWIRDAGSQAGVAAPVAKRRKSRERLAWGLFAGTLLVLLGVGTHHLVERTKREPASRAIRFSVAAPSDVNSMNDPVVSDDGEFLVYSGWSREKGRHLYLRELDRFSSVVLPGTRNAGAPFLSPDGRWIGFEAGNGIRKLARAGGDVLTVLDTGANGPGATWGREGTIVFSTSWMGGLAEVPDEGGEPRALTEPDTEGGEIGHWWPQFLPNGRDLLFTVFRAAPGVNDARVAVFDRESDDYTVLLPGAQPRFVPSGHLIFYRAGVYHAVAFDPDSLELQGEPVPILDEARELYPVGYEGHHVAVSGDGTLVFVPGPGYFPETSLYWIDAAGKREALPIPARSYEELSLSPDGERVALATLEGGAFQIRIVDLERGIEEILDLDGNTNQPDWHPDGRRLVWQSVQRGDLDIYWKDLVSGGPEEPLLATEEDEWPQTFTRDGERLLLTRSRPDGTYGISVLELGGEAEPSPLFSYAEDLEISPDDRWIAYEDDGIFVRPLLREGAPVRVSRQRGENPSWSELDQSLLYQRGDQIVGVSYREEGGRFAVDEESIVAEVPGLWDFASAPDGRILALVREDPDARSEIRVVLEWDREVARTMARRSSSD